MLTTCPECHTCFRVTQTQLDHRRGLVRCGRCRAVFNAYDTLLPELMTPAQETVDLSAAAKWLTEPPPTPISSPGTRPTASEAPSTTVAETGLATAETHRSEDAPLRTQAQTRPVSPDAADSGGASATKPAIKPTVVVPDRVPPTAETPDDILLSALPTGHKPDLSSWRSALWILVSVLLTLTLVLQTAYFLRAELAAAWPESRPILEVACQRVGCSIPLPRDPQAVHIEASSLETDPEDTTRATLRVSMSNRSDRIIAWPHLILTLTDVRDTPVAQRPFPPSDYLSDTVQVAQGMAPGEEREIRLDLELKGLSAYGYKLDKLYP